jgi:hypothetical protein
MHRDCLYLALPREEQPYLLGELLGTDMDCVAVNLSIENTLRRMALHC